MQSQNFIIFDDTDQIELILTDEQEQQKYYFDTQPFNHLFTPKNYNGNYSTIEQI